MLFHCPVDLLKVVQDSKDQMIVSFYGGLTTIVPHFRVVILMC